MQEIQASANRNDDGTIVFSFSLDEAVVTVAILEDTDGCWMAAQLLTMNLPELLTNLLESQTAEE